MKFITPNVGCTEKMYRGNQVARARHETINGRFKRFNVLSTTFRHKLHKQRSCFLAVATLVQMMLRHDEPVFDINYQE